LGVSVAIRVRVGRLGTFRFPAGLYVYTGRAARGLRARVLRHLRWCQGRPRRPYHPPSTHGRDGRTTPPKHWHIDYLLARREVHVERVVLASPDPGDECAVNQAVPGMAVVPGFGASDCRECCRAHLRRVAARRVVQ
jgi:Uri superfamily endonuclease